MRRMQILLMRLAGTFDNGKSEHAFSEELEGHLQMHTDENIRKILGGNILRVARANFAG